MKILITNAHNENRGDEAANRALIDELNSRYPNCQITLALRWGEPFPNLPKNVKVIRQYNPISWKRRLEFWLIKTSHYKLVPSSLAKTYINEVKSSDLVLHSPGGPSIGDIYYHDELGYIDSYTIVKDLNKPYIFFAPSMGPFKKEERRKIRQEVLNGAEAVIVRDPVSKLYIKNFLPELQVYQTLDSAFQFDYSGEDNKKKFEEYKELRDFLNKRKKNIGITITELEWHPVHSKNKELLNNIKNIMSEFIAYLKDKGYGVVFIPQLYGGSDDYNLMKKYMLDDSSFIVAADEDKYDSYFQQYLISRLYGMVGMRYHSNIFSAKVGTPFVSISYEQKMAGFMEKMGISEYCLNISDLSYDCLIEKFELMISNHDNYQKYLFDEHATMKAEALKTMDIVSDYISKHSIK